MVRPLCSGLPQTCSSVPWPLSQGSPCPAPVSSGSGAHPGWVTGSAFPDLLLPPSSGSSHPVTPLLPSLCSLSPVPLEKPPESSSSLNLGAARPTPL